MLFFFTFSNWEAYDSWQNRRGQPHKLSVLPDNGWRNVLNNLLALFNKSRWMLEWGGWKREMWFQEAHSSLQLKRNIIINGLEHHYVDSNSPLVWVKLPPCPASCTHSDWRVFSVWGGLIIKYSLSPFSFHFVMLRRMFITQIIYPRIYERSICSLSVWKQQLVMLHW